MIYLLLLWIQGQKNKKYKYLSVLYINMSYKPWFYLNPSDYETTWWRKTNVINSKIAMRQKNQTEVLAYFIIQNGTMFGNEWYETKWYINDPNRYNNVVGIHDWGFNVDLENMNEGDIVFLHTHPEIKYKVYDCIFAKQNQRKFVKILEKEL
jgi:hypothetical protein